MSYRKGRRLEYIIRDAFAKRGWLVVRAAASKPVDLVCMKGGRTALVECKYNKEHYTWRDVQRLRELAEKAGAEPVIAVAPKRGKPRIWSVSDYDRFKP